MLLVIYSNHEIQLNFLFVSLRIRNSIESHGLNISRAAFCGGESPHRYVKDFGVHLFLSSNIEDVKLAIESNVAAATIMSRSDSYLIET